MEAGVRGDEGGSSSTLQGAGEGERTLKRAVANLTVDKLILEEATKGNF